MKILILVSFVIFSLGAFSKEKRKKVTKSKPAIISQTTDEKTAVPCDSKEDILKKLEEKKKTEAEKGKAFSLQGGDTGCSVK